MPDPGHLEYFLYILKESIFLNIPPSVLVLNFSLHMSGMLFFPGWQKHFLVEENQSELEIFWGSSPPENYEHLNGVSRSFHEFL